jgi:hypothetical protein
MNNEYQKFVLGMGKVVNARHLVEFPLSPPLPHDPVVRQIFGVDWEFYDHWSIGGTHAREPYSCLTVGYKYYSQAMTGLFARTKFVSQKLGVIPDPQVVWDLIPLSFVIDWVIPIGEWLHRQRIDLVDLQLKMEGAGYGTRVTLRHQGYVKYTHESTPALSPDKTTQLLTETECRIYGRNPVTPQQVPKKLNLGGITLNKVLSGTALTWALTEGIRNKQRGKK